MDKLKARLSSKIKGSSGVNSGSDSNPSTPATTQKVSFLWRVCAQAINNSLAEEGIFRVEGDSNEINRLIKLLQQDTTVDLTRTSIHVVASVFKRDIRERVKPIIPIKFYKQVVASQAPGTTQTVRIASLSNVLHRLPLPSLIEMKFLFELLNRVAQHSAENKMTSANLANVFAPTVMRAHDPLIEQQNITQQIDAVRILIEKPNLITKAIAEAESGQAQVSNDEAQIGTDGREILRMVLGGEVLQFTEGSWKKESGKGIILSEEQLERQNMTLEFENQLLALENEELLAMLALSRSTFSNIEAQALKDQQKKTTTSSSVKRR